MLKKWWKSLMLLLFHTTFVYISRDDFNNKGNFTDNRKCLLATALKRKYPNSSISVRARECYIDNELYKFDCEKLHQAYNHSGRTGKFKPFIIRLIKGKRK